MGFLGKLLKNHFWESTLSYNHKLFSTELSDMQFKISQKQPKIFKKNKNSSRIKLNVFIEEIKIKGIFSLFL